MAPLKARSQKAHGILDLQHLAYQFGVNNVPADLIDPKKPHALRDLISRALGNNSDMIVRPCPVTPRHGFVDSIVLNGGGEIDRVRRIANLYEELLKQDEDGEIILMPFINAEVNAILTPHGITIGPDHDGATGGKDTISLPVESPLLGESGVKNRYRVHDDEMLYAELVGNNSDPRPYLVQARSGPTISHASDFIPAETIVTDVVSIPPDYNDLIEWEQRTATFDDGTVVHHPGGSLTSHFGVHCVLNSVPYITTFEPDIGDTLEPITAGEGWTDNEFTEFHSALRYYMSHATNLHPDKNPDAVKEHQHTVLSQSHNQMHRRLTLAVSVLHASGTLFQHRGAAAPRLLGWAVAECARIFPALVLGEARHYVRVNSTQQKFVKLFDFPDLYTDGMRSNRSFTYFRAYHWTPTELYKWSTRAVMLFGMDWNGSQYGGKPWKKIAQSVSEYLYHMLVAAQHVNNHDAVVNLFEEFNKIVTLAHNNGFWLNKIMNQSEFDRISRTPGVFMVTPTTYEVATTEFPALQFSTFTTAIPSVETLCNHMDNMMEKHAKQEQVAALKKFQDWLASDEVQPITHAPDDLIWVGGTIHSSTTDFPYIERKSHGGSMEAWNNNYGYNLNKFLHFADPFTGNYGTDMFWQCNYATMRMNLLVRMSNATNLEADLPDAYVAMPRSNSKWFAINLPMEHAALYNKFFSPAKMVSSALFQTDEAYPMSAIFNKEEA